MRWAARIEVGILLTLCALAVSCGPLLTVGGVLGFEELTDDDDDASNTLPTVSVTTPTGSVNDVVAITYRLTDPESDRASVTVEYDAGSGFMPATLAFSGTEGTLGLETAPAGVDHVFSWNASEDLGFVNQTSPQVTVRLTASDARTPGTGGASATTQPFSVFNAYITTLALRPTPAGVSPFSLSIASDGGILASDAIGHRVVKVDATTGTSSVLAGTGEGGFNGDGIAGTSAQLSFPVSAVDDGSGGVLVADGFNALIRRIDSAGFIQSIAGQGGDLSESILANQAQIFPRDLAVDESGNLLVLADESRVRVVNLQGSSPLAIPEGNLGACGVCFPPTGLPNEQSVLPNTIFTVVSQPFCFICFPTSALLFPELDKPSAIASFGGPVAAERGLYFLELGPLEGSNSGGALLPYPRITFVNHGTLPADRWIPNPLFPTVNMVTVNPGDFRVVIDAYRLPDLGELADIALIAPDLLVLSTFNDNRVFALNMGPVDVPVAGTNVPSGNLVQVVGSATGEGGFSGDGGLPLQALLSGPNAIATDANGNIYMAEASSRVRVATGATGLTFAGRTIPPNTLDSLPLVLQGTQGAVVTPFVCGPGPGGDLLITDVDVADPRSNRVLQISAADASVTTLAGSGVFGDDGDGGAATSARIGQPLVADINPQGTLLALADITHHRVRAVNLSATPQTIFGVTIQPGEIETIVGDGTPSPDPMTVGDGGPPTAATLAAPVGVFFDAAGLLWISDLANLRVRVANPFAQTVVVAGVTIPAGTIQTVVGDGTAGTPTADGDGGAGTAAQLGGALAFEGIDGNVYVTDAFTDSEARVRVLNPSLGPVVVAGVTIAPGSIDTVVGSGLPRAADESNLGDGAAALAATFRGLAGVSLRSDGLLFIADADDHRVRVVNTTPGPILLGGVTIAAGTIETLIGNGLPGFPGETATLASGFFASPSADAVASPSGPLATNDGRLFFCDSANGAVRMVNLTGGQLSFGGIPIDSGRVGVIAGSRSGKGRLGTPFDVRVDSSATVLFSDTGPLGTQSSIKQLDLTTRIVTNLAGTGAPGFFGDGGLASQALLNQPRGLHLASDDSLFVVDAGNRRVRFVNRGSGSQAPITGGPTVDPGNIDTVVDGTAGNGNPFDDEGALVFPGGSLDLQFPLAFDRSTGFGWVCDVGADQLVRIDETSGQASGLMPGSLFLHTADTSSPFTGNTTQLNDTLVNFVSDGVQQGDRLLIAGTSGPTLSIDGTPVGQFPVAVEVISVPATGTTLNLANTLNLSALGSLNYTVLRPETPAAVAAINGSEAYVAYLTGSGTIVRRLTYVAPGNWSTTVLAGTGTGSWNGDLLTATTMNLGEVLGMVLQGDLLFLADEGNNRIVAVHTNLSGGGLTETVASLPIDPGEARTVAGGGLGESGFSGDALPPNVALLNQPTGVATGPLGGVYVVDQGNGRLRRFQR